MVELFEQLSPCLFTFDPAACRTLCLNRCSFIFGRLKVISTPIRAMIMVIFLPSNCFPLTNRLDFSLIISPSISCVFFLMPLVIIYTIHHFVWVFLEEKTFYGITWITISCDAFCCCLEDYFSYFRSKTVFGIGLFTVFSFRFHFHFHFRLLLHLPHNVDTMQNTLIAANFLKYLQHSSLKLRFMQWHAVNDWAFRRCVTTHKLCNDWPLAKIMRQIYSLQRPEHSLRFLLLVLSLALVPLHLLPFLPLIEINR